MFGEPPVMSAESISWKIGLFAISESTRSVYFFILENIEQDTLPIILINKWRLIIY